jgi:6-phosphogluconolactonase
VLETVVSENPAAAAAERLATVAREGGHIALAGGSTPRDAYERLAAIDLDWSGCTLWFGDERCVPPDDPRSNFAMVRTALLDHLSGTRPAVRRMAGELGPHRGADAYERDLREGLANTTPALDLVLLGVGPDAHCASLFPCDVALDERERLAVGVERPGHEPRVPRISLTLRVINAARAVVFLVAGPGKADAVARAFASPPSRLAPASLVAPSSGSLTLLSDRGAAAQLPLDADAREEAKPGP